MSQIPLDPEKPTKDLQGTRGLKTDIFVNIRQSGQDRVVPVGNQPYANNAIHQKQPGAQGPEEFRVNK